MAQVHRGKNHLKTTARRYLNFSLLGILPVLFLIVAVGVYNVQITGYQPYLFAVVSALVSAYFWRKRKFLTPGIAGEDLALAVSAKLPDHYHVFNNLRVAHDGQGSELDLVIVGEKGVFVVEVKNHNGTIIGHEKDKEWTQHKVGRGGGRYSKQMYNPIKQVGTQVFRLAKNLNERKIPAWVQGVVFFTNPKADVKVQSTDVPVVASGQELFAYLNRYQPRQKLDSKTIDLITKFLLSKQERVA